jgi:hypothetical protein
MKRDGTFHCIDVLGRLINTRSSRRTNPEPGGSVELLLYMILREAFFESVLA